MRSKRLIKYKYMSLISFLSLLSTLYFLLIPDAHALNIKREVLDNGLVLLMVERHNLPMVIVKLGIKAGSVVEPPDKAGLSNLTAELLKAGTKKRTAQQIDEEIEFVGGTLEVSGGDDYVNISLMVLKKDIDLGFDLLSDIILNPVFPEDELKKRRNIIKGRLKASEDDPGFVASKVLMKEIFGGHPYARLVMGSEDGLDRIKREDIVGFHSSYYLPNNSIISVVGDITIDEVKGLIQRYLSQWRPGDIRHPDIPMPSINEKGKTIVIDKELTQTNITIGHAGVKRDNPDYYAISVMNYILGGGGFSSRLMQNIRDEKGLVYDINSSYLAKRYGGSFEITLQTKNESAQVAIEEVLKEVKRIREEPVSDQELEDARSFLIGSFPMRIETGKRIADFLIALEYYGLGMDYIDKYPEYIKMVTKEDIQRVAKEYLKPEGMIYVLVGDRKAGKGGGI
ncbi:MAG: pitrilysin family protein [Thermodesulfovibrionia bacterium]